MLNVVRQDAFMALSMRLTLLALHAGHDASGRDASGRDALCWA